MRLTVGPVDVDHVARAAALEERQHQSVVAILGRLAGRGSLGVAGRGCLVGKDRNESEAPTEPVWTCLEINSSVE